MAALCLSLLPNMDGTESVHYSISTGLAIEKVLDNKVVLSEGSLRQQITEEHSDEQYNSIWVVYQGNRTWFSFFATRKCFRVFLTCSGGMQQEDTDNVSGFGDTS